MLLKNAKIENIEYISNEALQKIVSEAITLIY